MGGGHRQSGAAAGRHALRGRDTAPWITRFGAISGTGELVIEMVAVPVDEDVRVEDEVLEDERVIVRVEVAVDVAVDEEVRLAVDVGLRVCDGEGLCVGVCVGVCDGVRVHDDTAQQKLMLFDPQLSMT